MTTPPQFSPDGQWWWDGQRWVPAAHAPQPQPPQPPWGQQGEAGAQALWALPQQGPTQQGPTQQGFTEQAPWAVPQQGTPPQPAWGTAPPQPQYLPYGTPPPKDPTDGKAIGSLVASVVWACGIGSVVGVVLGHLSRAQAKREGREPSGLALAGLILGYLGIVAMIGVALVALAFKDPIVDAVQNDMELQSASDAQQALHDASGRYATSLEELRPYGYDDYDGTVDVRIVSATDTSYCMTARSFGETYYASDEEPTTSTTPCR